MELFSDDFDENIYSKFNDYTASGIFTDEELAKMFLEIDKIINSKNENPNKQALAYVRKFQLLRIQYKLAPKLLEKALALQPDMPQALIEKGCFYLAMKNKDKALKYFSKSIKLEPDFIFGYSLRYDIFYEKLYDKLVLKDKINAKDTSKLLDYLNIASNDVNELIRLQPDNFRNYQKRIQSRLWNDKINFLRDDYYPGTGIIKDFAKMILLYADNELNKADRVDLHDITVFTHNVLHKLPNETRNSILQETVNKIPVNSDAYWLANYLLAYDIELEDRIDIYNKIINEYKEDNLIKLYCYIDRANLYALFAESFFNCKLYSEIFDFENAVDLLTETLEYIKNFNETEFYYEIINIYYARGQFNEYFERFDDAIHDYSNIINLWKNGMYHDKVKKAYGSRIRLYKKSGKRNEAFSDYMEMWDFKDNDNGLPDFVSLPKYVVLEEEK